jgi:putative membrane-bound dehydrogenase-like protein
VSGGWDIESALHAGRLRLGKKLPLVLNEILKASGVVNHRWLILMAGVLVQSAMVRAAPEHGDSPKDLPPESPEQAVPLLSGEDAIKAMKVAEGFHVELVAEEPMVEQPIQIQFDGDGRMWVVEMRGFMLNVEGKGENQPIGRISILQDTDGDGKMDKRTVFLDGLVMPRAIGLANGGALVAEPPKLTFYEMGPDGKGIAQETIATDYGISGNPEHQPNGLMRDIDNWYYNANYEKRFRFADGKWISDYSAETGQFGISQDDRGRLFHNNNGDVLRGSEIPPFYIDRNSHYRAMGANIEVTDSQQVWPSHVTTVNRGYDKSELYPDNRLKVVTAACGPVIYRGGAFPTEFAGNAFACEPCGNLVKREILSDENGTIVGRNAYKDAEFLTSTNERFRPVNLSNGPDGALYVVDMHHGIIQHLTYLTTYAKNKYHEKTLDQHLMTGRIYRIVANESKRAPLPKLNEAKSAELVAALENPNGWWRDTAQRLLVEQANEKAVPLLRKMALNSANPLARLHARWTLEGMHRIDTSLVAKYLGDSDAKNRAAAIRLAEPMVSSVHQEEILPAVLKLASDPNADVRLQFCLTISPLGKPETDAAIADVLREGAENLYVREAAITGLRGRELEFIDRLLARDEWSTKSAGRSAMLLSLTKCVIAEASPKRVSKLLATLAAQSDQNNWRQLAMMDGFAEMAKTRAAARGVMIDSEPKTLTAMATSGSKDAQQKLPAVLKLVHWPGQPGYTPPPPVAPLTAAQQVRFAAGKQVYAGLCIQCHKVNGLGQEGLAPPLDGSEWAAGAETRMIRIVLNGLRGPVTVKGKTFTLEMPSLQALDDEKIANVLTYVRREWDNTASPIEPATVAAIRAEVKYRQAQWTERELLNISPRLPKPSRAPLAKTAPAQTSTN